MRSSPTSDPKATSPFTSSRTDAVAFCARRWPSLQRLPCGGAPHNKLHRHAQLDRIAACPGFGDAVEQELRGTALNPGKVVLLVPDIPPMGTVLTIH